MNTKIKKSTQLPKIGGTPDRAILVSVAEFKARLGHYLREIKSGKEVLVTDRRNPIALVSPFQEDRPFKIETVKPQEDPSTFFTIKPKNLGRVVAGMDSLSLLLEDRKSR